MVLRLFWFISQSQNHMSCVAFVEPCGAGEVLHTSPCSVGSHFGLSSHAASIVAAKSNGTATDRDMREVTSLPASRT